MSKTTEQWMAEALAHMKQAQWPPEKWCAAIQEGYPPGHEYNWMVTQNFLAQQALWLAAHPKPVPPPPVVPPVSGLWAGVGVFTAWDSPSAIGLHSALWVALQLDDEGGQTGRVSPAQLRADGYKHVFGWEARASQAGVEKCRILGLDGYIGQAESEPELQACLSLNVSAPKALVGNVTAWSQAGQNLAAQQGWALIAEWYWNVQPWMSAGVDTRGYPLANTLLGCYDATAENPPYGRRVPLSDYLASGKAGSSWSVYLAETLTAADRKLLA